MWLAVCFAALFPQGSPLWKKICRLETHRESPPALVGIGPCSAVEWLRSRGWSGLDPSLRSAAQSLTDLLANTDKIENASKAVATVIVAALIPATVKYTTSLYAQVSAQLLANTQSVRTINALGQVAVAAGSATVATNGLAMATKFLLGPWGLLLAAVTAAGVAYSLTNEEVEKQNKSLDEQNKITELRLKRL